MPPASALSGRHLRRLTSLRAFAALVVFLNHLDERGGSSGPLAPLSALGYTGVGFFFLLSGFVLTWTLVPGDSTGAFYVRRFARVWPSHAVMLVAALLLPATILPVRAAQVPLGLTLLQSWIPSQAYTLNGVSWSLSCEAFFYAALPLTLVLLRAPAPRGLGLVPGAAGPPTAVGVLLLSSRDGTAAYVWPPLRFGDFLLGVAAALALQRGWRLSGRTAAALMVTGLLLTSLVRDTFPLPDLTMAPVFFAVVLLAAQADLADRPGWLTRRALVYAGQVSFAFYLVHELVMLNLPGRASLPAPVLALAFLTASVVAAMALHHGVERPCERRLRALSLPGGRGQVARRPLPIDG